MPPAHVFTVGHSTRSIEELTLLLSEHGVKQVVDVRHFPRSRRNPQFNLEALERELPARGLSYVWMGDSLGGFRKGGYLPYMDTPEFAAGISRLEELAERQLTSIMCAEIVWFRCHRRFIARRLVALGHPVTHLVSPGKRVYPEP
jgi:uncharacterized protein (DUF488 family)